MAMTLPQSTAEITDAWLSEALGASVTITNREPIGSPFACEVQRLTLDGFAKPSVVSKLPVTGEIRAMLDGINAYAREVRFYADVAPDLPIRTPEIYASEQATDSTDFVLVMEDLTGGEPVDQLDGFSPEQATAVVDALAAFHAWSWGKQDVLDKYAEAFWPVTSEPGQMLQQQYGGLFAMVWGQRRDALVQLLPDSAIEIADRFGEVQPGLVQQLSTPMCITHGELRADNLMFAPDGTPVFFDFQAVQQECGTRELSYLLGSSVHPDVIADEEQRLLTRYHEQLVANGVADYSLEQAQADYRLAAAYNLIWGIMANIRYEDSPERGKLVLDALVTRAGAAVERLGGLPG